MLVLALLVPGGIIALTLAWLSTRPRYAAQLQRFADFALVAMGLRPHRCLALAHIQRRHR